MFFCNHTSHAVNFTCLLSNGLTSFLMKCHTYTHTQHTCIQTHTHTPVKALLCVHTMNCKCCLAVTIANTFCNVVLQCVLIYYGYYIWIYLMTQDIVDIIVFFNFFFFFFTCLWLFRSLPLKKEIITTEHIKLVELNSDFQLK